MKPENMTILTVDDTPANIRLLTHHLEKQGYRVITAEDGFEGFKAAIQYHPDIILLDIMMPGTDGYEVCELLKAEEQTRDIPVMFLTAKADVEDKVRGFELGAVDYITKPFNLVEISTRVQNQLRMIHFQQQNDRLKKIFYHIHPALPLKQAGHLLVQQMKNQKSSKTMMPVIEAWLSMADSFSTETEPVNIKYWIDDVVEIVQGGVSGLVGFNVEVEQKGECVDAYPGLLHLALLNVFMNAYEAMNSKGFIHISREVCKMPDQLAKQLEVEISESYYRIDINDKGIADGRAVFNLQNPYEITDMDFKEFTLRLAAVHQIMLAHGGALDILNDDKKGQFHTFLYLPV
ncbi:response regulator [bacterium]|nr:response regulator [bacterium]